MAKGLQLPLQTKNGRLTAIYGDDYIDQLVKAAFLGSDSDNPFQTMGLGQWMIFGINDAMSEGEIREQVKLIFQSLQADQLARLPEDGVFSFSRDGGDLRMQVEYVNMETQERPFIEVPVPPGA